MLHDEREELVKRGAVVTLRDGSRVRIRECHRIDDELLVRGFARLGEGSRYKRFLTPVPALTKRMVRYLPQVDCHDHEALIALGERSDEAAVTVIDDWQHRGLGALLLEAIGAGAHADGQRAAAARSDGTAAEILVPLRLARLIERPAGGQRATSLACDLRSVLRRAVPRVDHPNCVTTAHPGGLQAGDR